MRPLISRQGWLVTFSDLVLLMTTFFVMLLTMSRLDDPAPFVALSDSFADAIGTAARPGLELGDPIALNADAKPLGKRPGYLATVMAARMADSAALGPVVVRDNGDAVILSLPADLLFAPASAQVSEHGETTLRALAPMLDGLSNQLVIIGRADPRPPRGGPFTSNWELALARAQQAALTLRQSGLHRPPAVLGHGVDASVALQIDQETPAGDADPFTAARRVDIMVLKSKGLSFGVTGIDRP